MKKGFIIYCDMLSQIELLTDEEAGQLYKAILRYVNNHTIPAFQDRLLAVIFEGIRLQIDRDSERYAEKCRKTQEAAQKRWERMQTYADVCKRIQKHTDIDTDIDSDTDIEKEIEKDKDIVSSCKLQPTTEDFDFDKFKDFYNEKIKYLDIPKIIVMSDSRKAAITDIVNEFGKEAIAEVMDKICNSTYLMGESGVKIKTNFDWIFRRENFIKIMEGNYDD